MSGTVKPTFFRHPSALVESTTVGAGTRIWAFAHVLKGARIGQHCNIGDHCFVEGGARIGDNVTVKNGVAIWEGVVVADNVFVGPFSVFTNDLAPRSPRFPGAARRYASKAWLRRTVVEAGASIGANATILCGTAHRQFRHDCGGGGGHSRRAGLRAHGRGAGAPDRMGVPMWGAAGGSWQRNGILSHVPLALRGARQAVVSTARSRSPDHPHEEAPFSDWFNSTRLPLITVLGS